LAASVQEIEKQDLRGEIRDARDRVLELVEQRYVLADEAAQAAPDAARHGNDGASASAG
jgi:hypothetical protein